MCVHVYVCTCLHVCVHVCERVCACTWVHMCLCVHMYVCARVGMSLCSAGVDREARLRERLQRKHVPLESVSAQQAAGLRLAVSYVTGFQKLWAPGAHGLVHGTP